MPDNTSLMCLTPMQFHRRQLHVMQPVKSGVRKPYGGTISEGFKRGSIVRHKDWGLAYVGGAYGGNVTLHSLVTGARLSANVKPYEVKFLAFNSWRFRRADPNKKVTEVKERPVKWVKPQIQYEEIEW